MKKYFKRFSRLENDRCIAETGNVFWLSSLPDLRLSDFPPRFLIKAQILFYQL